MSCLAAPVPPLPTLPGGFSLAPPSFPTPPFDAALCCKILNIPAYSLQPPVPPLTLNPAWNVAIKTAMQNFDTFVRQLAIPCPLEE